MISVAGPGIGRTRFVLAVERYGGGLKIGCAGLKQLRQLHHLAFLGRTTLPRLLRFRCFVGNGVHLGFRDHVQGSVAFGQPLQRRDGRKIPIQHEQRPPKVRVATEPCSTIWITWEALRCLVLPAQFQMAFTSRVTRSAI